MAGLERERTLVQAAILLVASGAAPRVTVIGLRHAGLIVPDAERAGLLKAVDARVESARSRRRSRVVIESPSD